jgi:uncharacterized protein
MDKILATSNAVATEQTKPVRGFATLDEETRRSLARKGGQKAHQLGRAHEFSSDEAREAGRKGGHAVSRDRAHMAAIGRKGGEHSGASRRSRPVEDS